MYYYLIYYYLHCNWKNTLHKFIESEGFSFKSIQN